ncbi:hypothetical protein J7E38_00095 [Bacillus sp. ISL-35]|uniref:hypothetical protein n=1 Tax=Bacillus sp. ISL-35 TaxID=2819122 RepID=UPI001BED38C5|nr:hypothetical protein [Bacillus sp. ISL-35]MBT2677375.1 hypothetical protein [Bacillus sp. ISL-35]MBT2702238.1 hypothetical protein [Chryseobacterium sp. ISL-80]
MYNTALLNIGDIGEEISTWNDYEYNLDFDKDYYNNILLESQILVDGSIDKDNWILKNELLETHVEIDFRKLREESTNWNLPFDLILAVKCWVISLIEQNVFSTTIQSSVRKLKTFFEWTNGVDIDYLEDFKVKLETEFENRDKSQSSLCASVLNFFNFYPEAVIPDYFNTLKKVKRKVSSQMNNRNIPSFEDLKIFHTTLMDYVPKLEVGSENYLRYFPLYLWWNITCVIPIRPSEFCHIPRKALSIIKGKDYLQLPRKKQKKNKARVQIIDQIFIPEHLAKKITEYVNVSDKYGQTNTLISYPAYSSHPEHFTSALKVNPRVFSSTNLAVLLESFYYHIVQNEKGFFVNDFVNKYYQTRNLSSDDKKKTVFRRVRPGDTRHFAMMNLLRQGYHSVEMARLAGHTSLNAQNPYQAHDDLYYDFELIKIGDYLKDKFSIKSKTNSSTRIPNSFIAEKIDVIERKEFKDPLNVGYCIDKLKRCSSIVSETHIFCPYWKISNDEFTEKKELIAKELNDSRDKVKGFLDSLFNLHTVALKEYFNSYDYKEDNIIHRHEINKINRYISSEMSRYDVAIKNLTESGVLNNE